MATPSSISQKPQPDNNKKAEPPVEQYSQEAEEALLGALLIDPSRIQDINLDPEEFHVHKHQWIFQAMLDLQQEEGGFNTLTLTDRLEKQGRLKEVGGPAIIPTLVDACPEHFRAREYADIIREKFLSRRKTEIAQKLAKEAISPNGSGLRPIIDELQNLHDWKAAAAEHYVVRTWSDMSEVLGPITWAWQDWLPNGMLTILAGETGMGKSILALRIAACFLQSDPWPDKKAFAGETGAVLWCEAESAQALNLERAHKWELPMDKIYTPLDDPLEDIKLDNPDHWSAICAKAMLPEVKLIVVDSLRGANAQDENSSETMTVVQRLAALARDTGKPIMLLHHLRKKNLFDGEGVGLERLRGSSAIVQTARLVWALDRPDPQALNWDRLQQIKNNMAKFPEPIGLTIEDGVIKFGLSPEAPKVETIADKAVDLLMALLADEPMEASKIEDEFKQVGISWRSATRAKEKLGISSIRKNGIWIWSLPPREEKLL